MEKYAYPEGVFAKSTGIDRNVTTIRGVQYIGFSFFNGGKAVDDKIGGLVKASFNILMPITNVISSLCARGCSRRTKAAHRARAKDEKYIGGHAPLGDIKDPNDRHNRHSYLDKYISMILEDANATLVQGATEQGFAMSGELRRLRLSVMDGTNDGKEHPLYERIREYICSHPLPYQERATKLDLYHIA